MAWLFVTAPNTSMGLKRGFRFWKKHPTKPANPPHSLQAGNPSHAAELLGPLREGAFLATHFQLSDSNPL